MPVLRSEKLPNEVNYVLWHITESVEMLEQAMDWTAQGLMEYKKISHPQKQAEWLAGRLAAMALCEDLGLEYGGLQKDEFGKPHLVDAPGHISLTNCFPFAAAGFHAKGPVGIDLEIPREKLHRLATKFLDDQEQLLSEDNRLALAIRWSAKEALYKLHGRKRLAFKEDIKTGVFALTEWGYFGATLQPDTENTACRVYFKRVAPDLWLTVALERVVWQVPVASEPAAE